MINSPTTDVKLPEEIQNAIEAGRNNVSVLKAESERLQRLCGQLEKEIKTLNDREVYITGSIEKLVVEEDSLIESIKKLEAEKASVSDQVKEKNKEIESANEVLSERDIQVSNKERKLGGWEAALIQKSQEVEKLQHSLDIDAENMWTVKEKLNEVITSINNNVRTTRS